MSNAQKASTAPTSHVHMTGVPVEQFLQLAEVDRKTCTVLIRSGGLLGALHFRDGAVIEAQTGELTGIDAAMDILSWEAEPEISVRPPMPGVQSRISEPISYIMMESARLRDEGSRDRQAAASGGGDTPTEKGLPDPTQPEHRADGSKPADPGGEAANDDDLRFQEEIVTPCVALAARTPGVEKMALVLRDGTLLAEYNGGGQLGTLLAYLAMEAERIRQALKLSHLRWITLNCESGERIVAVLGNQVVLGLRVAPSVSPQRLITEAAALIQATAD